MLARLVAMAQAPRLRRRWRGEEPRVAAIIEDLRAGEDWTRRLRAEDGRWEELEHLSTCPWRKLGDSAAPRDLRGITLRDEDLAGTSGLADTVMDFADLANVRLEGCVLNNVRMRFCQIGPDCEFADAHLAFVDLRSTRLVESSFDRVAVEDTDLRGVAFENVSMTKSSFVNVKFAVESVVGRWFGWGPTTIKRDSFQALTISDGSDQRFRDHVQDEQSVERLKRSRPMIAAIWHFLSNYGRSPTRLLLCALSTWALFGWLFAGMPGPLATPTCLQSTLAYVRPRLIWSNLPKKEVAGIAPYYFSAVTLTTEGYGDITPSPDSRSAQVLAGIEAFLGVFLWSALVSIFLQNTVRSPP